MWREKISAYKKKWWCPTVWIPFGTIHTSTNSVTSCGHFFLTFYIHLGLLLPFPDFQLETISFYLRFTLDELTFQFVTNSFGCSTLNLRSLLDIQHFAVPSNALRFLLKIISPNFHLKEVICVNDTCSKTISSTKRAKSYTICPNNISIKSFRFKVLENCDLKTYSSLLHIAVWIIMNMLIRYQTVRMRICMHGDTEHTHPGETAERRSFIHILNMFY